MSATVPTLIGRVVKAQVLQSDETPDIDRITLYYADGRTVIISSVGDWGQESWVRVEELPK